jgi:hypothetical protein
LKVKGKLAAADALDLFANAFVGLASLAQSQAVEKGIQ